MYIGSADLMPRNLYNRVELVTPIFDGKVRAELTDVLDRSVADNTNTWELGDDGGWTRRRLDGQARSVQRELIERHTERSASTAKVERRRPRPPAGAGSVTVSHHDAHGYWLAEADRAPPGAPPRGRPQRRRRRRRRRVHGPVDGAWHVKRLEPEASVIVVEAQRCGEGPSGRNGGFVNGLWFSLPNLRRRFGGPAAIAIARAAQDSVAAIGDFCREEEVDAWYRQAGYLQVSTAPAWDSASEPVVAACRELGEAGACVPLGAPRRSAARCASPIFPRRGVLSRCGDGAAGAARPRARGPGPRPGGGGLRAHRGRAGAPRRRRRGGRVRRGPGAGEGGRDRDRRRDRRTARDAAPADPDLQSHRDHRAGAGAARGDRWTGGECITDSRSMIPLLPHHAGRADRFRLGRGTGRVRRPHRRSQRARPAGDRTAHGAPRPILPRARGAPARARVGRPDRRLAQPPARRLRTRARRSLRLRLHRARGRARAYGRALARLAGARSRRRPEPARVRRPATAACAAGAVPLVGGTIIAARSCARRMRSSAAAGRAADARRGRDPERIGIHIGR